MLLCKFEWICATRNAWTQVWMGSKVWVLTLGILEVNSEVDSLWDGLWRPGGAFFQMGFGFVMSHHQPPHKRAQHIPVLILAGKFKMEFLPTVSHWKGFPVAQICPNSHKIVSSCIRAFPVAQIRPNSHKIAFSFIRAFHVAQICPNSHKIVFSCIKVFPVAQICPNSH